VQVDPVKLTLKAPGTKHLKLKYDKPLSNFAFKFNLRRYNVGDMLSRWSDGRLLSNLHRVRMPAPLPANAPGRAVHVDPMKPKLTLETAIN